MMITFRQSTGASTSSIVIAIQNLPTISTEGLQKVVHFLTSQNPFPELLFTVRGLNITSTFLADESLGSECFLIILFLCQLITFST